jgi:hypothetical protein
MNWDWHHALERAAAVFTSLLGALSHGLEVLIDKIELHPNVAAATIYFGIVVLITLVVAATRSKQHINKIQHRTWNKAAARHAWTLALIVFFANGVLHAVGQTRLLTGTPLETSHLSANTVLWLVVNGFLGLVVLGSYTRDAIKRRNFGRPKPALKYFGRVFAAWGFEDLISMYWEHYGTKEHVGELLRWLHTWNGQSILIAISALTVLLYIELRRPSVQGAVEDGLSAQM